MTQIIYPTMRLLANPRIFLAIAKELNGPDWETLATAFYELIEHNILDDDNLEEVEFDSKEVCFRSKPDDESVIQLILQNGSAIELKPFRDFDDEDEYYACIKTEEDFTVTTTINAKLIRAIEEAAPEVTGDVALCEPPTPANEFLRDPDDDCFRGRFHLMSNPDKIYDFSVAVVDMDTEKLKAQVNLLH